MTDIQSPNKYRVLVHKFPDIQVRLQKFSLPGFSITPVNLPTNENNDIPVPGDKIYYENLVLTVLTDTLLTNYQEIHTWLNKITEQDDMRSEYYSDISIDILDGNYNVSKRINFINCFPYSVSQTIFDSTVDENYIPATDISFAFNYLEFE